MARLVFAYFRWRGFVARGLALSRQVAATADLARRYDADPSSFSDADLARAVPGWVGEHLTIDGAWLRALQQEPRLWLRARPDTAAVLAAELGDCSAPLPRLLPDALVYTGEADLFRHATFQAGRFELQDVTSQAVGALCAPRPGESWWDACAGEGGKALDLADRMQNRGVIWATDRADWRLQRLRLRAARAERFNLRWALWDGGGKPPTTLKFDGVLVDAPCSGLGTWQRNPHARWTTTPDDVAELAVLQTQLLHHAAAAVKPGGRLFYAVCTLTREETTEVAARFAAERPDFEPFPLPGEWQAGSPGASAETAPHLLWLRPQDWQGNGMFVAAWRRR